MLEYLELDHVGPTRHASLRFAPRLNLLTGDNGLGKTFLLAVAVGLRRKEIDLLEWSSFRWEENAIRIQPTRFFHPKSEDSLADLPVDAEVMDLFRKYQESQKAVFVIKSSRPPLPAKPRQYLSLRINLS